jgi:uncharacterized protein YtpQ (UPF0354 family)
MISHEDFLIQAIEVANRIHPAARVVPGEGFGIVVDGRAVFLENAYRKARLAPEQVETILEELLTAYQGVGQRLSGSASFTEIRKQLMPQIFPTEKVRATRAAVPVSQEFPNETAIVYVADRPDHFQLVLEADVQAWGVDVETVHRQALANLTHRSEGVNVQALQDTGGQIMAAIFQKGDSYDSSRLLLPTLHQTLGRLLGSPFLAGVPNRDFLICLRADAGGLRKRIAAQVREDFRRMPYPITDQLFLVTADGVAAYRDKLPGAP